MESHLLENLKKRTRNLFEINDPKNGGSKYIYQKIIVANQRILLAIESREDFKKAHVEETKDKQDEKV